MTEEQTIHTHGYDSYHLPASRLLRLGSLLTDACWIVSLFILSLIYGRVLYGRLFSSNSQFTWTSFPPGISLSKGWNRFLLTLVLLVALLAVGAIYRWMQLRWTGRTLGHRIWNLQPKIHPPESRDWLGFKATLYQRPRIPALRKLSISLLMVFHLLGTAALVQQLALRYPYWISASSWDFEAFLPPTESWMIGPFFYALGGWPNRFENQPVHYGFTYEYGPPTRFLGHLVAHWADPEIKMILEGPKTPSFQMDWSEEELRSPPQILNQKIQDCFTKRSLTWNCLRIKETALSRHIQEMVQLFGKPWAPSWDLRWFTVRHPKVQQPSQGNSQDLAESPEFQLTQGIYLSAQSGDRIQDRFVLINESGSHQTLILNRPDSPRGRAAFELFQKLVGSLQVFSDLNPGRAWINRELSEIQLNPHESPNPSPEDQAQMVSKLIEIQSRLISKISVDPGSLDTFFHLAGTSLLLAKNQGYHKTAIGTSALQNLKNAYRYALDLSPTDPKTRKIQEFWAEAQRASTHQEP